MESKQIDVNKTLNEPPNENLESIMKKYFIPPQTVNYMKWGQSFMIILLFYYNIHKIFIKVKYLLK